MKTIIAIDPGTKCGWAVRDKNGTITSGVANLAAKRHESQGMRFIHAARLINQLVESAGKDRVIVYEEVRRHAGTDAAHVYGGIVAVIQTRCIELGIEYHAIPVGTIKKTATGKGNASKEQMVAAAKAEWPEWMGTDDNEADARWIAHTASETLFAGGGA